MWTVLFATATIVFAIRYLICRVQFKALLYYIVEKEYTAPTKKEMEQCITVVTRKTLESWFKK